MDGGFDVGYLEDGRVRGVVVVLDRIKEGEDAVHDYHGEGRYREAGGGEEGVAQDIQLTRDMPDVVEVLQTSDIEAWGGADAAVCVCVLGSVTRVGERTLNNRRMCWCSQSHYWGHKVLVSISLQSAPLTFARGSRHSQK